MLEIPELTSIFKKMDLKNVHMNMQCMERKNPYEHAMYVKKEDDGSTIFMCLYVDDLIFTSNNPTMFEDFKKSMVQEFEMIDISLMTHFLSLEVI